MINFYDTTRLNLKRVIGCLYFIIILMNYYNLDIKLIDCELNIYIFKKYGVITTL